MISAGYDSSASFRIRGMLIPPEATFTAQVRQHMPGTQSGMAATVLLTMSTASGTITHVIDGADTVITLIFSGAESVDWNFNNVVTDVVRTDTVPVQYMGFKVRIPVSVPATRIVPP